jgi:hypothetical protein
MARNSLAYIPVFSMKFFFQPIYTDYSKVTTLDKDLARNISAKYGSNPFSGS